MKTFCFLLLATLSLSAAPLGFMEPNIPGLVGWWPLNESAGTVALDFSGSGLSGNYSNSPTQVAAVMGNGLTFASSSSNMVQTAAVGSLSNLTVFAWAKFPLSGQAYARIADTSYETGANLAAENTTWSNLLGGVVSPSSPYGATASNVSPGWHACAVTRSGTNVITWVDGIPRKTNSTVSTATTAKAMRIGGGWANGGVGLNYFLTGSVDDVRVYNRALDSSELLRLHNSGSGSQR